MSHQIKFAGATRPKVVLERTMVAEFFSSGETVRMVITMDPMHTDEFTKMSTMGMTSQLTKLDKRFGSRAY